MKHILSALLIPGLLLSSAPAGAQSALLRAEDPPKIELREQLTRGDTITVELKSGRRISGTVGDAETEGFWIERPPAAPTFVDFRAARFLRDPNTDAVVARVSHDRDGQPRWLWPALGVATVVGILVVATGGRFPLGFFVPRT